MIRYRLVTTLLTGALAITMPSAVAAQDGTVGPEGTDWKLSAYLADDEIMAVPFGISAGLLLEAGRASGSGGCNTFSGSYQLDGTALTFSDEFATTMKLCGEDIQAVEDEYLAVLPQVSGWAIAGDVLELRDEFGDTLLAFELPSISLTASELAGLVTILSGFRSELDGLRSEIGTLRRDMTGLNVDRLRERIKVLERDRDRLQDQVAALEESARATPQPPSTSFSAAETILLEAIPARISSRCTPLRSELPKGAKAGVACVPNSSAVASVDYYLLEGSDAAAVFQDTMETFNVPEATSESATCATGDKSQRIFIGSGWQSEGCYRTAGKAELRFVDNATDCRQLKVGGKRLKSPALYIALQGAPTATSPASTNGPRARWAVARRSSRPSPSPSSGPVNACHRAARRSQRREPCQARRARQGRASHRARPGAR